MSTEPKGDGRFRFIRLLGDGGQGVVHLADDTLFGGQVAVKLLRTNAGDQAYLEKLIREEASLMALLSPGRDPHPNIVAIHDIRNLDDHTALVMEFMDGGSVADRLGTGKSRKPLPPREAVAIAVQLCDALKLAYQRGVIHRDIKPPNILCRQKDQVYKLTDWGVAKNIDLAGCGRTFAGTPPYMPPEVILLRQRSKAERSQGSGVDHRADIYSLGVTLYEMITISLPYGRDEDAILAGPTPAQTDILRGNGADDALTQIILKAMAPDPGKRFQNAVEFQQALSKWMGNAGAEAELDAARRLQQSGDHAAAERAYLRILQRFPSATDAYVGLARLYVQLTRLDSAMDILNRGLQVAPGIASLWIIRGRINIQRNPRQAVTDLQQALKLGTLPEAEARWARQTLKRLGGA